MRIILTILLIFITNNSFAFNYVRKAIFEKELNDKYSAIFDIDYRNNSERLFRRHYDIGIQRKFKGNIKLSLNYRHIYIKNNGEWDLNEQRPQIQISKRFPTKYIDIITRIRHDYQMIDGDDINRTRFRLGIVSRKSFLHLKPLINNEFYYNINDNRYEINRFQAGFILPTYKYFTPSIIFRQDSRYDNRFRRFTSDQILFLKLNVKF